MTPIPLDQIGFRWRDHRSALWWLGTIYARPEKFAKALRKTAYSASWEISVRLLLHALPYVIALNAILQYAVFNLFSFPIKTPPLLPHRLLLYVYPVLHGVLLGTLTATAGIIAFSRNELTKSLNVAFRVTFGITFGVGGGIAFGIVPSPSAEIIFGIILGSAIGIITGIISGIFGSSGSKLYYGGLTAATLSISIIALTGVRFGGLHLILLAFITGLSAIFFALRLYYYPFHYLFVWPKPREHWYPYHPIVWNSQCGVPFIKLHRLLVSLAGANPKYGQAEVERLITEYPSQRMEGLRSKTILLIREAASMSDLSRLSNIMAKLPEGERGFLGQVSQARDWIDKISLQQIRLNAVKRAIFREPNAELLYKEIENFRHRVAGLREPLAKEFQAAAAKWIQIAQHQLDEARHVTSKEPRPQLFRAGDPVKPEQEAFSCRDSVIGELEQQIMLKTDCPGIVLYGRRRTGKSTILQNLAEFLPSGVQVISVSMQHPTLFTSQKDFLRSVISEIHNIFPDLTRVTTAINLSSFFGLLASCDKLLEKKNERLLLAIDEYEVVDKKIGKGIFRLDLLETIRESIQTHRRITWIFAGSHEITELANAEWTSYLVSARTIEVPFFTLAETQLLLTDPLKYSSLWRNAPHQRPQFDPAFWGDAADNCGIERIQAEAAGWPHLVQLIAETIVDLINEEDADGVSPELMERALNKAIVRGHNVLHTLMRGESLLPGEWDYLSAFREIAMQAPPADRAVTKSLRRRLLIEENGKQWQLRVPLMARWLKVRGE